ncbi:MAG: sialidase family protein [Pirellulales bacterium]
MSIIRYCAWASAIFALAAATFVCSASVPAGDAADSQPDCSLVPGQVIFHSPASSGIYVGSPGIVRLLNGDYLAKCDEFGPRSTEKTIAVTRVFRSSDRGETWKEVAVVPGMYWASIFVHREAAYLMGPDRLHGRVVIMRSTDAGHTWSTPTDGKSGLLLADGRYHSAPVPVVVHRGRIWKCMEHVGGSGEGMLRYEAFVLSASADSDLLDSASWSVSNYLPSDRRWLDGNFAGWLEGNAVVTPAGELVDILRVNGPLGRLAAAVHISKDGSKMAFDPKADFVDLPGGATKFTIRRDEKTKRYYSLANYVLPGDRNLSPAKTRNTLALIWSSDLVNWSVQAIIFHHSDPIAHAFQYVDWEFDGEDLIAASRTAYDDGLGGAHNAHDANFLTFHRIRNFRTLSQDVDRATQKNAE